MPGRFRRSWRSLTMRRRKSCAPIPTSSGRSRTDLNPLELTLGIMTAVGGFVDISQIVFSAQAGSIFGYALIFAFVFATIGMMVFVAAMIAMHPPWDKVAGGLVPQAPAGLSSKELLRYGYFGVAILSAVMFPYEAYFYSSGGIEEQWGPKDLFTNRATATVGFGLGSLLSIAMLAIAAQLFAPANVAPELPGSVALQTAIPVGKTG